MKKLLEKLSIRNKLIVIILSVTLIALFASLSVYTIFTLETFKDNLQTRMEVTARLIKEYEVGPILFEDQRGAQEILEKLNSLSEIEAAYVFSDEDSIYAEFHRAAPGKKKQIKLPPSGLIDKAGFLYITQPIDYRGQLYGYIVLKVDRSSVYTKMHGVVIFLGITLVVILALSWVIATLLQRYISLPILSLAKTTKEITHEFNFELRVSTKGKDEIGLLYQRFNDMLSKIQHERDQQERYAEALKQSEQNYRNIFENSVVGIFRIEPKSGKILQANRRTWEILGVAKPDLENEEYNIGQLTHSSILKRLAVDIFNRGAIDNFEIKLFRDEKEVWVSVSGKYYPEVDFFEGVIQDISERKKNFLQLKKVNFELDNFVYHASHDLRSPLRSILGLVQLTRIEDDVARRKELLDHMETSVNRLDNLITTLLTFSKNNRLKGKIVAIDLRKKVEECLDLVEPQKREAIDFMVNVQEDAPFYADETRFGVVLNNLISNAVKYQREEEPHKRITIHITVSHSRCLLMVADNGEGILAENQERIYEMFYRASETSDGSGLGLYIVKNVIDNMGGEIWFETPSEGGTIFYVELPNQAPFLTT